MQTIICTTNLLLFMAIKSHKNMIFNVLLFMKSYDLVETLHDSEMFKPYKCSSIQVYSWGIFTSSTSSTSSGLDSHVTSRDPDRYVELLYTFLVPPLGVVECCRPPACVRGRGPRPWERNDQNTHTRNKATSNARKLKISYFRPLQAGKPPDGLGKGQNTA